MPKPILIAYATRCGATREVAQEIAKTLVASGLEAQALPYAEVAGLDGYRAMILGSAVRYGRWLKEATAFVEAHQDELAALPHALFTVHYLNLGEDAESQAKRATYTRPLLAKLRPKAEAFFHGKMAIEQLPLFEKLLSKAIRVENGDQRDWERIRAWARELGGVL